eukprot:scaffold14382_cov111-Isochrysis_galbana.AAC.5
MEVSQALLPLLARNLCRPRHPLARNLCRPRPRACPYHPWGRPTTAAHAGQNAESCPNASTMRKKYNTEPVASLRPRAESDEKKLQPSRMCAIAIIYQKSKAGLWRRCPCHLDAKRRGRAAMPGAAPGHAAMLFLATPVFPCVSALGETDLVPASVPPCHPEVHTCAERKSDRTAAARANRWSSALAAICRAARLSLQKLWMRSTAWPRAVVAACSIILSRTSAPEMGEAVEAIRMIE